MDDLISRAAVLRMLDENSVVFRGEIEKIPAVDAVPVVHARWINYPECLGYDGAYCDENIVCSNCESVWNIIDNEADRFDYCPTCGAKMDGERRDGE